MTREQIKEIQTQLAKWREKRHLRIEGQQEGFMKNILEEFREYFKAKLEKDKTEQIDAICDIAVIAMNTVDVDIEEFFYITPSKDQEMNMTIALQKVATNYLDALGRFRRLSFLFMIRELIPYLESVAIDLGYDFYLAMQETIKQINSRDGYWDETEKKFIKTTPKEEQYQANYELARINDGNI